MRIVISEARHRQVIGVSYIIVMYCIIFCGRTVWSVTYILDKNYLQHLMNQWINNGNATNYYASMLCFYLVFEVRTSRWLRVGLRLWARLLAPRRCPLSAMVCVIARASRLCSFERTAADHTTLVHFFGGVVVVAGGVRRSCRRAICSGVSGSGCVLSGPAGRCAVSADPAC